MTENRSQRKSGTSGPDGFDAGSGAGRPFLRGCRQSLPLAVGVAAYGLVFGILARQAGLSVAEVGLMSGLVFTGSAQFVVLTLWAPAPPILAVVLATLTVNLRYVLMAAALRDVFRRASRATALAAAFFICDESWALTTGEMARGRGSVSFLAGSGLILYMSWLFATLAGRLIGATIGDPARWGVDFAFTATFLALLVGMARGRADILPWCVAAASATLASIYIPGKWYIVIGGLAGAVAGGLRRDA